MKRPLTSRRSACSLVILVTLLALGLALPVDSADAPPQFGNFFSSGTFSYSEGAANGTTNYPIFGRVNVADNNSPIPTDRVYLLYNHFHNTSVSYYNDGINPSEGAVSSANQYSVGVERTLLDPRYSLELRLPLFTNATASTATFDANVGCVGNLTVINKWSLYNDPTFALTAGLGISLPTGGDARFSIAGNTYAVLRNQSVHLQPFLGFLSTPTERSFFQGFIQMDTPLNSNGIRASGNDRISDQAVLFLDVSAGHWLYRNIESRFLTGLAPIVELHYTTALQGARNVELGGPPPTAMFEFGDLRHRFNMLNLTYGLHTEFCNQTQMRVAGVVPLTSGDNNFFSTEIQAAIIRKF